MKYLLDTNVLSEAVKSIPNKNVMRLFKKYQGEIVTSAPVWHEMQYGCKRLPVSKKKELIKIFLDDIIEQTIPILPYDERAAKWHGAERARLSLKGETPSFVDGQIASIAVVNNLVLVTRNISDFKKYSNIKLQNWHKQKPVKDDC